MGSHPGPGLSVSCLSSQYSCFNDWLAQLSLSNTHKGGTNIIIFYLHPLNNLLTHSLIHSFTHSLIHSLTHSLIHSLTHSQISLCISLSLSRLHFHSSSLSPPSLPPSRPLSQSFSPLLMNFSPSVNCYIPEELFKL